MACGKVSDVDIENVNGTRVSVVRLMIIQLTAPLPVNGQVTAELQVSNRSVECSCPSESPSYLQITFSQDPFSYHSACPTDGLLARLRPTFGRKFDYSFVFHIIPAHQHLFVV
jgi:hypothetical protein